MVVFTEALSKQFPFNDSGRLCAMAVSNASKFRCKSSSEKFLFPNLFIIQLVDFTLNSTRPCFACVTQFTRASYLTRVPLFTFGISPFGPRILAYCFKVGICSGVAIILSNSILPASISLRTWSSPMTSAPTFFTSSCYSYPVKTQTFNSFPVPAGRTQVPLMFQSPLVGSTFSLMISS